MDATMGEILGISTLLKLATAFVALWVLGWLLRRYDGRLGIAWKVDVWPRLSSDGRALAIYFGARFVGCCLLIGYLVR